METTIIKQPAIRANGLSKTFGPVVAVKHFDLTVKSGEIIALLGPNGAGKSTAIDLMLGLQIPDLGSVEIYGMTPKEAIARGLIGAMQQSGALFSDMTVMQMLKLLASTMGHHRPIDEVAELAGITQILKRRVGKCSGGEQQRIRMALALLSEPLFLFLDEPTVGMDVAARTAFWQTMQNIAAHGCTILFATHYLAEAQQYAERTVIIRSGEIIADGSTNELAAQYASSRLSIHYTCSDAQADAAIRKAQAKGCDWTVCARDGFMQVEGKNLDEAARAALHLPGAHNLEVTRSSIEDAYLTLVSEAAK